MIGRASAPRLAVSRCTNSLAVDGPESGRAGAGRGRAQQVAARVVSADDDFGPHPIYEWAFHAQLLLHKQSLLAFGFWEDRLVFHYSSMTHEGKCPNDVKR